MVGSNASSKAASTPVRGQVRKTGLPTLAGNPTLRELPPRHPRAAPNSKPQSSEHHDSGTTPALNPVASTPSAYSTETSLGGDDLTPPQGLPQSGDSTTAAQQAWSVEETTALDLQVEDPVILLRQI
jgi:hypothetical protein